MRAKVASKPIDYPPISQIPQGENKLAWRGFVPLARVPSQVPFFRVFGGQRRSHGFPFGLHRNGPFWAASGPYRASIDGLARMGGTLCPPQRKVSAQDAPACLCERVPDATSAVSHVH